MLISYYTIKAGLNPAVGFGYAGQNIVKSLQKLGHTVKFANPKADIQLNFTQPHHYKLHRGQYQIGYTPWESTKIRDEWKDKMNLCDEIWATSDWVANVYKQNGITVPIHVYPHGIEPIWKPQKRVLNNGPLKFLHVGEPSPRKDGQLATETFIKLFGNNPDYHLTIKAHGSSTIRVRDKRGNLFSPDQIYTNITVITDEYPLDMLVDLYHRHHVLLYPTWGEGFGFIPLQALATGMPVISTYNWAQYKDYLGPLKLRSTLTSAEMEGVPKAVGDPHVGSFYKPNKQDLEDQMWDVSQNFKAYSGYYFAQSTEIHKEYNWLQLTNKSFDHIFKKFL